MKTIFNTFKKNTVILLLTLSAVVMAASFMITGISQPIMPKEPPAAVPVSNDSSDDGSVQVSGTFLDAHGALHVSGTQLSDKNDEPVALRGISTHGLAWFPQYVNRETFTTLRDDWGVNLIRLAMYTGEYGGYCTGGNTGELESLIDKGAEICRDLGIYCIIDWHILSDGNPNTHIDQAVDFFNRMSAKYASWNNILYEICNEPNGTGWNEVRSYADTVISVIRNNDDDAIILVGTPTWSQDVDVIASAPVSNPYNVMYSLHFYAATHGDFLRSKLETALNQGTPVFVSEFGICDASGNGAVDYDSAEAWKSLIDQRGISCAAWNLSNKAETSALLLPSCAELSDWQDAELSETGKWIRNWYALS